MMTWLDLFTILLAPVLCRWLSFRGSSMIQSGNIQSNMDNDHYNVYRIGQFAASDVLLIDESNKLTTLNVAYIQPIF